MAGTICQYYYTFGYLTMAGLAFLLNDSWQVHLKSLDAELVISYIQRTQKYSTDEVIRRRCCYNNKLSLVLLLFLLSLILLLLLLLLSLFCCCCFKTIQIYPPASTNRAHTSIHPLPLLLVSFFDSSPSTNFTLVMQFSLICRKNVELLKYLSNICQISDMPWLQVDCSRVCAVAVVQQAL